MEWAILSGAPLGVAATLISVVLFTAEEPSHELAVQAGWSQDGQGPVRVALSSHEGSRVQSVALLNSVRVESAENGISWLEPATFGQAEGQIRRTAGHTRVSVEIAGEEIFVTLPRLNGSPALQGLRARDERMLPIDGAAAEPELTTEPLLRVVGGLCVVGSVCEVLLWGQGAGVHEAQWTIVGGRFSAVSERLSLSVTRLMLIPDSGQVRLRSGVEGGPGIVRDIPMALSSGMVSVDAAGRAQLRREIEPEGVIADTFFGGRWLRTESATGTEIDLGILRAETVEPGLYRVQIRDEPARESAAGVRVLFRPAAELTASSLGRALGAIGLQPNRESISVLRDERLWEEAPQAAGAFVLAQFETHLRPLPAYVYGRPAMLERVARERESARWIGVLSILFLGLLASVYAFGRGWQAREEAGHLMDAVSEATQALEQPVGRRHSGWSIIAVSLLIMLAFLFVAALYMSRWIV